MACFTLTLMFNACTASSRPPLFPESEFRDAGANTLDQNPAAEEAGRPADASAAPEAAAPTAVAGQPLVLRATTPLGMAEAIEVAFGEDGRLVICGARIGPMVVDASDQAAPRPYPPTVTTLGGARYRRCSHVTVVGSTAYVTFRADSTMPSYLAAVELSAAPAVVAAYNAPAGRVFEASVARNGLVMVAMHQDGLGVFERAGEAFTERATLGGLTNAYGLALDGSTLCVADGEGGLATVDVSDPGAPRVVGRVATGGVAQSVVVDPSSHMAYVNVGAGGVVIVDVARPEAPALAGRVATGGTLGQLSVESGRLYVAAWRDVRVYALDDPRRPALVGVARPAQTDQFVRVMGVAARGDAVAVANWNYLQTWRFRPGHAAPYLETSPEPVALGRTAVGATAEAFVVVENLGRAPLAGLTARSDDPAFEVDPTSLTPEAGESRVLRVRYRAADLTPRSATLALRGDGDAANAVAVELHANSAHLTVGDRAPDEVVQRADGSEWRLADQRGHAVLLTYFTTWCPVCGLDLPDVEVNVWRRYRARGLEVVGVDPPLSTFRAPDTLADVTAFVRYLGLTFPLGVSTTSIYDTLRMGRSDESAPFPLTVLVDPAGRIAYLGTTINPVALDAAIERTLSGAP